MSNNRVADKNYCFISIMFLLTLSIIKIQVFNTLKYSNLLILRYICDSFGSIFAKCFESLAKQTIDQA